MSMFYNHIHEFALFSSIVLTIVSQILLRAGSRQTKGFFGLFANSFVITGYALFPVVVLLVIFAMQGIPLKTIIAWISSTFFLVPLAGKILVKDPFTKKCS